jgi:hypothetical protein
MAVMEKNVNDAAESLLAGLVAWWLGGLGHLLSNRSIRNKNELFFMRP